jgi:copper/silver efflux system protein
MPIKTRIDMLSTGIKTPVGIKVMGDDLAVLSRLGEEIEAVVRPAGHAVGHCRAHRRRRYLDITIDRLSAARYGINVGDHSGGHSDGGGRHGITETVEGLERYPVNVRYDRDFRSDPGVAAGAGAGPRRPPYPPRAAGEDLHQP